MIILACCVPKAFFKTLLGVRVAENILFYFFLSALPSHVWRECPNFRQLLTVYAIIASVKVFLNEIKDNHSTINDYGLYRCRLGHDVLAEGAFLKYTDLFALIDYLFIFRRY